MNATLGSFVCNLTSVLGSAVGGLGASGPTGDTTGYLVTDTGEYFVTDGGDRLIFD